MLYTKGNPALLLIGFILLFFFSLTGVSGACSYSVIVVLNVYLMSRTVYINCGTFCQHNLQVIGAALEEYHNDKTSYPSDLQQLVPGYVNEVPECTGKPRCAFFPITYKEIGTYKPVPYKYEINTEGSMYSMTCRSENHWFSMEPGFPRFTSEKGLETSEWSSENHSPENRPTVTPTSSPTSSPTKPEPGSV